jgi:hypothetical protein
VAVTDGDLIVSGDADGAVEIVAVAEGAYRVTDNGVLIADETTLTGVTDDIHIKLEESIDGTNDVVTVDLGAQAIDRVYAQLGDGDNTFQILNGTASGLVYRGGDGIDSVSIDATIESRATVTLGDGDNDLAVNAAVGNLAIHGGDGADLVAISEAATVSRSVMANLGDGDNSLTVASEVDGNVRYDGGDGNDTVALLTSAVIGENFSARLGDGENSVTHEGTVEGDFRAVSFNEDDTVDIAETAVVGGETILGLGEQQEFGGGGGCGRHGEALGRALESLALNGRALGFYYRGFRR